MSDEKFTPAPWNNCDGETIETKEARICIVAPLNLTQEESDANAALIAAAPDMYEELKWHCALCMLQHPECEGCEICETRKVLKKVRGES